MPKYKAAPFSVTLIWFEGNGVKKRKFKKYLEAVEWANKNIEADEIAVRIIGTIKREE